MEKPNSNLWFKIALLAAALAVLCLVTIKYTPAITQLVSNTDQLRRFLLSYGRWSVLVFIALQMVQVVIAAIPGEITQFAGGYLYGTVPGTVYSLAGIMAGSVIVFYLTRLLGYPVLKALVPQKSMQKFEFLINDPKGEVGMFVLFAIPGIPKDVLTYIAGMTPVRALRFFVLATMARFPGVLLSSFIGAHFEKKEYTEVIIASALAVLAFILGLLIRDRIIKRVQAKHPADKGPPDGIQAH
jgi:uncharacterized membrane protein YdjX (TVP38/TMEM64 family)